MLTFSKNGSGVNSVSFRPFPIGEILYYVEEGVFFISSEEIKVTEASLMTP